MKKAYTFLSLFLGAILGVSCCQDTKTEEPSMEQVVNESLDYCVDQAMLLARTLAPHPDTVPVGADWNGKLISGNSTWWTSGFYPGQLWYLYEYCGDDSLKNMAELFTGRVEKEQYTTNNHDVGFIIFCSVGNQYRITGSQDSLASGGMDAVSALRNAGIEVVSVNLGASDTSVMMFTGSLPRGAG